MLCYTPLYGDGTEKAQQWREFQLERLANGRVEQVIEGLPFGADMSCADEMARATSRTWEFRRVSALFAVFFRVMNGQVADSFGR